MDTEYQIIHCTTCGSTFGYSGNNTKCLWCGATYSPTPGDMPKNIPQGELYLPPSLKIADFEQQIKSFVIAKINTPDDIFDALTQGDTQLVMLPVYKFNLTWQATWNAIAAYSRQKPVYNQQEQRFEEKKELEWQPIHGEASGTQIYFAPGADVIAHMNLIALVQRAAENVDSAQLIKFIPEAANATSFMLYDIPEKDCFNRFSYNQLQNEIEADCLRNLPDKKYRDFQFSATHKYQTTRMMVPFFWRSFYWRNQHYFVIMDAVTGLMDGDLPTQGSRQIKMIALAFVPLSGLVAGAILHSNDAVGNKYLFWAGLLPLFLTVFSPFWYQHNLHKRRKKMAAQTSSERLDFLNTLKHWERNTFYTLLSLDLVTALAYIIYSII